MHAIHKSAIIPYTPQQMFELVNNIKDYPNFLKWCEESDIHSQTEDEVIATLHLAGGGFKKSFTTRNLLRPYKMIEIQLIDGPFKYLEGFWQFKSLNQDKSCEVQLDLKFEFLNFIFTTLVGPIFQQIANTLMESFHKRANEIYQNDNH